MIGRIATLFAMVAALCLAADLSPGVREAAATLQRGDFAAAEAKLRAELQSRPDDVDALSLLGAALDNQNRLADAEAFHQRAIAATPGSARAFGNFGHHLLLKGDQRAARGAFQKALAIERTDWYANVQLAQLALGAKDGKGALVYLDNLPAEQRDTPEASVLRLTALELDGAHADAEAVFQRLSSATRDNAELSGSLGWTLARAGLYDRAEALLGQALALQPSDFRFLYNLGVVAVYGRHYDRARELLESAVRQQPDNVDALYSLAFSYSALKQPETALRVLAKATRLAPNRADIVRLIAVTTGELSADEDSAAAWDRYLTLVPSDDTARRERGFARTHIRQFETGMSDLQWYVGRHPDDPKGYYQLGLAQSADDPTKGIENLNKALKLKPDFTAARAARGALYYVQGNAEAAVPDLEAAAKGDPSNGLILDRLGQAYRALDKLEDSIRVLRRAAELAPGESVIVLHLASALAESGKSAESETLMGRYRQARPTQAPRDLMRYLSLTPEQQRIDYRERVQKAVSEHPEDPIAQVHYLKLSLEDGQIEQAIAASQAIAKLKPGAALLGDAGRALLEARQYGPARDLLEKAAADDPSAGFEVDVATAVFQTSGPAEGLRSLDRVPSSRRDAHYHLARAQMLDGAGESEQAITSIRSAIAAAPKDPVLFWQASVLLCRHERSAEALDLLSKAAKAMPQEPQIPVLRAVVLETTGKSGEAMSLLDDVRRRWPESPALWVARGMIQAAHAQHAEARQALTTAVSLGARSPEVQAQLADSTRRAAPDRSAEAESSTKDSDPRRLFQLRPPREW
jgi:tetratricopeptide (TPR) repeat protein